MERKLYRSKENKMIAGVCGGLAEYLNVDPTIVRVITALIGFLYGTGILIYIIAAILIPQRQGYSSDFYSSETHESGNHEQSFDSDFGHSDFGHAKEPLGMDPQKRNYILGGALVLFGLAFLLRAFFHWLDFKTIISVALIVIGAIVITNGRRRSF